jgi:hypothetical protein
MNAEKFPARDSNKLKNVARAGAVLIAGGISNVAWGLSISLNRALEATDSSKVLPAVGFALGSTAIEYGLTYAATAGDIDTEWNPKRRLTKGFKKILSKSALIASSWRGAAGGMYIDQIDGREPTPLRRLAHAATYGFFMGAWVSDAGSKMVDIASEAFQAGWETAIDNPAPTSIITAGAIALGAYGLGKTEEKIQ